MLYTHRSTQHSSKLLDAVGNTCTNMLFPDVTVVVDDERIPCHRFILASMCPYFYTMFHSGMKETTDREIVLKGVEPTIMKQLVQYLYTGTIAICADSAPGLLQLADMYDLNDLHNGCIHFYTSSITPATCLAIWKVGNELQDRFLSTAAFNVAAANFDYVVEQAQDFLELSVDELARYLACENLKVQSEERVFDAALTWLASNSKYAGEFHRVVAKIRLTDIHPKVLDKTYLTKKEIYVDKRVTNLLHAAINHQLHHHRLPVEMNSQKVRHHGTFEHNLVILGGSQQSLGDHYSVNSGQVLTSGMMSDKIASLTYTLPQHSGTSYLASCLVQDLLYVSGLGERNNEVWCYHGDNRWTLGPSLNTGRWNHTMVVGSEFKIYVLGGYSSLKAIGSIEELNSLEPVKSRRWKSMGYLCEAIGAFSALCHSGSIYTFGGRQDFTDNLDLIQKFDIHTSTCSILNITLPVASGASRLVTWACYAILVDAMATIVINLETMEKLITDVAGKLCVEYDMKHNPVFRTTAGIGLQGFSMNRIGDKIFIVGGELVEEQRGTGTYSRAVLKGFVDDLLNSGGQGKGGWFEVQTAQLMHPLAYHTATVVKCRKKGKNL